MQISIKYVFSYLLFKYYTDAVRPLFVTEKFRFMCVKLDRIKHISKRLSWLRIYQVLLAFVAQSYVAVSL